MKRLKYLAFGWLIMALPSCREEYVPPATTNDYNYLVVEGFINVGGDSSYFTLSRTQPPGSNTQTDRENGAVLNIITVDGITVSSSVSKGNGAYALPGAALDGGMSYQLRIVTSSGTEYLSDPVKPKLTPAIDSVTWSYDPSLSRVNFFANTHDATNSSRCYRWEFEETWEYRANYESRYEYLNGVISTRPPERSLYRCWSSESSNAIIIGSSAALTEDVISSQPLHTIVKGGNKFNVRHSLLVKQYAIDEKAYAYWLNLRKMTETGGSIFDAQPTELVGNLRCVSKPDEPVIGYLSAHTVADKCIFVDRFDVPQMVVPYPAECVEQGIDMNPADMLALFGNGNWIPIYLDNLNDVYASTRNCVDCTFFGGTTVQPSFW